VNQTCEKCGSRVVGQPVTGRTIAHVKAFIKQHVASAQKGKVTTTAGDWAAFAKMLEEVEATQAAEVRAAREDAVRLEREAVEKARPPLMPWQKITVKAKEKTK